MSINMRIGINGAGSLNSLDEVVEGARKAEADGFHSFWIAQIFGVDALTAGAMKVALALLALFSVTCGPLTCVQRTDCAALLAVPRSVTVLPALTLAAWPDETVIGSTVTRSPSSSHPASRTPPNTAVVIAVRPPRNVCRRE
jgi:alkanesulfonate monooxygenase SsuD/methylene tetrahydromethanopterin reductase-like flavin-dependent oxidoreductase (luciferase family)